MENEIININKYKIEKAKKSLYNLNVQYFKDKEGKPDYNMFLWLYLMERKYSLKSIDDETGKFYLKNKRIIDNAIKTVREDLGLTDGKIQDLLVHQTGFEVNANGQMKFEKSVTWTIFGEGICLTSWALVYRRGMSLKEILKNYNETRDGCKDTSVRVLIN
jgi:ABC-type Zn2+ transport system substrate-binding protein/surface adhesin